MMRRRRMRKSARQVCRRTSRESSSCSVVDDVLRYSSCQPKPSPSSSRTELLDAHALPPLVMGQCPYIANSLKKDEGSDFQIVRFVFPLLWYMYMSGSAVGERDCATIDCKPNAVFVGRIHDRAGSSFAEIETAEALLWGKSTMLPYARGHDTPRRTVLLPVVSRSCQLTHLSCLPAF